MERRSTTHRTSARIRIVGFMLGLAVAATVVGASRIPAGAGVLGADVAIVVAPTGELALKHPGRVLAGTILTPASESARRAVRRSATRPCSRSPSACAATPTLPTSTARSAVELTGPGDQQLFRGSLADFRDWTEEPVLLGPGVWSTFGLPAWIRGAAGPGYAGRMVQVDRASS